MAFNQPTLFRRNLEARLWRMWALDAGRLVVELREGEHRTVRYQVLGLPTLKPLTTLQVPPSTWWSGVHGFTSKLALLYELQSGESPVPARLLAFDLATGKQRWVAPGRGVVGYSEDRLWVEHPEKEAVWIELDLSSGQAKSEGPADPSLALTPLRNGAEDLHLPVSYAPGSEHYQTVAGFVAEELGHLPTGPVDYLAEKGVLSLCAHLEAEGGLEVHWLILDEEGQRLHHQRLGTQLQGLGLDSFVGVGPVLLAFESTTTTTSLCAFSLS